MVREIEHFRLLIDDFVRFLVCFRRY